MKYEILKTVYGHQHMVTTQHCPKRTDQLEEISAINHENKCILNFLTAKRQL